MMIHLIRHGQTISSGRTYAGRSDVILSDCGRAQANGIADTLSGRPIAAILSSPLSRAVDTARPLARRLGLETTLDAALMEMDFGIYEGRSKDELGLKLRASHAHRPVPGGESLHDVWTRSGRVLDRLTDLPIAPGTEIAVVGHYWINRLLFGRARGLGFDQACRARDYRPQTGSVMPMRVADARLDPGQGPQAVSR